MRILEWLWPIYKGIIIHRITTRTHNTCWEGYTLLDGWVKHQENFLLYISIVISQLWDVWLSMRACSQVWEFINWIHLMKVNIDEVSKIPHNVACFFISFVHIPFFINFLHYFLTIVKHPSFMYYNFNVLFIIYSFQFQKLQI